MYLSIKVVNAYKVNCDRGHHYGYHPLCHPGGACRRAPSAIEEASSVVHETNRNNSTGMHCTNAHLGANLCQMCRFPVVR
jgi:hypothetical protein